MWRGFSVLRDHLLWLLLLFRFLPLLGLLLLVRRSLRRRVSLRLRSRTRLWLRLLLRVLRRRRTWIFLLPVRLVWCRTVLQTHQSGSEPIHSTQTPSHRNNFPRHFPSFWRNNSRSVPWKNITRRSPVERSRSPARAAEGSTSGRRRRRRSVQRGRRSRRAARWPRPPVRRRAAARETS